MTDPNTSTAAGLVSSLTSLGVAHACVTPGSRSTPLTLAAAACGELSDWVHHDERSAAFFGLGIARATGRPVALICTSGTAAAEYLPAIVEARNARIPLVILTADRPRELRETGAPQMIDQQAMYGHHVKWSQDLEPGDLGDGARLAALAARLFAEATTPPAGPVHLNVRFREPLLPGEAEEAIDPPRVDGGRLSPDEGMTRRLVESAGGKRGVVLVGPQVDDMLPEAAVAFASAAGWPVVADALSGLRRGRHDRSHVIQAGDPLAWAGWWDAVRPEMVVRVGANPTSKPVWQWLEGHREVPQVLLEPAGWRDPTGSASAVYRVDPAEMLAAAAKAITGRAEAGWLDAWRAADSAALAAIEDAIEGIPFPSEPGVVRAVAAGLGDGADLWVASSMPVRDVDAFLPGSPLDTRIMSNRGVNGIDGTISTAAGSAATSGRPTTLITGDLAVLHDLNALATIARLEIPLQIVAVNNDGGGIFEFLPQRELPEFERLFATPHGLEFVPVARALGLAAEKATTARAVTEAVASADHGPRLTEVRTDRTENHRIHQTLRTAVATAVGRVDLSGR